MGSEFGLQSSSIHIIFLAPCCHHPTTLASTLALQAEVLWSMLACTAVFSSQGQSLYIGLSGPCTTVLSHMKVTFCCSPHHAGCFQDSVFLKLIGLDLSCRDFYSIADTQCSLCGLLNENVSLSSHQLCAQIPKLIWGCYFFYSPWVLRSELNKQFFSEIPVSI